MPHRLFLRKKIEWVFSYSFDDEEQWHGFVDGIKTYWIKRGGCGSCIDSSFGDSCVSDENGKEMCQKHLEGKL